MVASKKLRVSNLQQERMLHYMMEHPNFACGKFNGPLGRGPRQKQKDMWIALAIILNDIESGVGAVKDWPKWQQVS